MKIIINKDNYENYYNITDNLIRLFEDGYYISSNILDKEIKKNLNFVKFEDQNFIDGISNLGNTYYFNFIIQVLFNIEEFREDIINLETLNNNKEYIYELIKIFKSLKNKLIKGYYEPYTFFTNFENKN